jgi:peroxiredoxin
MEGFKNHYQEKGIEIIAISQLGKDKKTVEDSIRKNKLTLRFLYDPQGKVTELFSGKYVPGVCPLQNIYIIQKDAKIAYRNRYPGVEESEIIEQLDKIRGE